MNARVPDKSMEWPNDTQNLYNSEPVPHLDVRRFRAPLEYFFSHDSRTPCGLGNDNGNMNLNYIVSQGPMDLISTVISDTIP